MSQGVLWVAIIFLWVILLVMGIWSWLMPLLILVITIIDASYGCSIYYQLSSPVCLCPGQQATTCSASSTRIYKTTANHGKYHSPLDVHSYKNSQARDQQEGEAQWPSPSQFSRKQPENLTPLFPKIWPFHLLKEEYLVVRIGKRSPKWWWLKDKEREKPLKMEQKKIQVTCNYGGNNNNNNNHHLLASLLRILFQA